MSTTGLIKVAKFVRDLLSQPESIMHLGRANVQRTDFTALQIAIDSLGPATRLVRGKRFNSSTEKIKHVQQWSMPITVDFYGDGASAEADRFCLLLQSEDALTLRRTHAVQVLQPSQVTNVKLLAGEQFSERVQVELNAVYNLETEIDTLYLNTAVYELREDQAGTFKEQ